MRKNQFNACKPHKVQRIVTTPGLSHGKRGHPKASVSLEHTPSTPVRANYKPRADLTPRTSKANAGRGFKPTGEKSDSFTWDSLEMEPPVIIHDLDFEPGSWSTQGTKDQHDFMDEWIGSRRKPYLETITRRDSPHGAEECGSCSKTPAEWRCKDCLGNRAFCRDCCRGRHGDLPFHRIEFWTGTHYEKDWLCNLGVVIHLGHHGEPCPVRDPVHLIGEPTPSADAAEHSIIYTSPSGLADKPRDCQLVTVADLTGIHKMWIRTCSCREGDIEYDFLQLGLYPASYTRVDTVFTFDLLHNCRLDNLECKTSVYHLWSKLKRLTCPFFPNGVPNRHQELFRVLRQWRNLKQRQWSGQPYDEDAASSAGSMALFCNACPQPGVNLPEDWQQDPVSESYIRTFTMDGNFSAVHQKRNNALPEKCLTSGELYMVEEKRYKAHVASVTEYKEPVTCNEHHAVKDRFIAHKGLDVTGIGATACARHGCFCPGSVVNFVKGESQASMDYSLCNGVANSNVSDIPTVAQFYDIGCQHSINFRKRVASSAHVSFPFEKNIYYGVGAFHISGHVPQCFPRYSPQFMPGVGIVDGEVLESLWSTLNEVSTSAQTASLAARTELLDDHMLDSNWKKVINQAASVIKKYQSSIREAEESERYYLGLCENLDPTVQTQWEDDMVNAQQQRTSDVKVMDIFNPALENAPSCAEKQLELIREESASHQFRGSTAWIAEGLEIQEIQLQLTAESRRLKKEKSHENHIAFVRKRQALDIRIEKHQAKAEIYLPPMALDDINNPGDDVDDGWVDSEWKDIADDGISTELVQDTEKKPVFLPSTIGHERCAKLGVQSLVDKEIALREGQANDALQAIRLAIGEKSFRFRKQLRVATSKKKKTRSWDGIHVVGKRIQHYRLVYRQARHALGRLGINQEILQSDFRELTDADLQTSTAVMEPNARGQRKKELSWIWQLPRMNISNEITTVNELYRVNWMRARSRRDRWQEEVSITSHEMVWIVLWFQTRADVWRQRATRGESSPGLASYPYRQAAMWDKLKRLAAVEFQKVHKDFSSVFGYDSIKQKSS